MIRVKVFTPVFCKEQGIDSNGWLEIPDESTLADALKLIHLPKPIAKLMMVKVNGVVSPTGTKLYDGDIISFFPTHLQGG